jgi:hypothetical protein
MKCDVIASGVVNAAQQASRRRGTSMFQSFTVLTRPFQFVVLAAAKLVVHLVDIGCGRWE